MYLDDLNKANKIFATRKAAFAVADAKASEALEAYYPLNRVKLAAMKGTEEWEALRVAYYAAAKELDAAKARMDNAEQLTRATNKALAEQAAAEALEALAEVEKLDGTPIRYKAMQKAIAGVSEKYGYIGLSESSIHVMNRTVYCNYTDNKMVSYPGDPTFNAEKARKAAAILREKAPESFAALEAEAALFTEMKQAFRDKCDEIKAEVDRFTAEWEEKAGHLTVKPRFEYIGVKDRAY